jgi:hypothetical protein
MQSPNQHQNKKLKINHQTVEMSTEVNLDEKTLNRFSRQNAALGTLPIIASLVSLIFACRC